MFCNKCGKELLDGTKFCSGCGIAVGNDVNVQPNNNSAPRPLKKQMARKSAVL